MPYEGVAILPSGGIPARAGESSNTLESCVFVSARMLLPMEHSHRMCSAVSSLPSVQGGQSLENSSLWGFYVCGIESDLCSDSACHNDF